jgi:uncharacterized protein YeaO (DUF488 family)
LLDRLRPRGISKDDGQVDEWFKEVAPTDESRKWSHDSSGFPNFSKKYRKELEERAVSRKAFGVLAELARGSNRPTPVYASKDTKHNNAAVLKKALEERIQLPPAPTSPPENPPYAHSAPK